MGKLVVVGDDIGKEIFRRHGYETSDVWDNEAQQACDASIRTVKSIDMTTRREITQLFIRRCWPQYGCKSFVEFCNRVLNISPATAYRHVKCEFCYMLLSNAITDDGSELERSSFTDQALLELSDMDPVKSIEVTRRALITSENAQIGLLTVQNCLKHITTNLDPITINEVPNSLDTIAEERKALAATQTPPDTDEYYDPFEVVDPTTEQTEPTPAGVPEDLPFVHEIPEPVPPVLDCPFEVLEPTGITITRCIKTTIEYIDDKVPFERFADTLAECGVAAADISEIDKIIRRTLKV